ncbi:hypothetical protein RclHR1_13330002 [Rhizophagus clarus]|uniref:Uncharacterized protein n=1 Tax=Rhizophagus clarus TaxID=94130 RepID=A0A2Z6Q9U2_9GLOM|nr:hypothetical protein RclHR1_13330002 [Rhizophagus clarus]
MRKRRLFVIELIDIISLNYIVIMSHLASEIFKRSLVTPVTTAKFSELSEENDNIIMLIMTETVIFVKCLKWKNF